MTHNSPVSPVLSATLIIGRDKPEGLEIFMVVRHRKVDFASGALVFPGGKVDEIDRSTEIQALCDGVDGFSDIMLSVMVAAIRETFEESGILLARYKTDSDMVSGDRFLSFSPYRDQINSGKISFIEFLKKEHLRLACDKLTRFAHWITPEVAPKRFDTQFFLTKIPDGQKGIHDGSESVDSVWLSPKKVLEQHDAGIYTMMFPTIMNIQKMGQSLTLDDAIEKASSSEIVTVTPWPENRETGPVLCIPKDAGYLVSEVPFEKAVGPLNLTTKT